VSERAEPKGKQRLDAVVVVNNSPLQDAGRSLEENMSESFAQMLEESFAGQKIKTGAILTGIVVGG
jgi:hypothetical protein